MMRSDVRDEETMPDFKKAQINKEKKKEKKAFHRNDLRFFFPFSLY